VTTTGRGWSENEGVPDCFLRELERLSLPWKRSGANGSAFRQTLFVGRKTGLRNRAADESLTRGWLKQSSNLFQKKNHTNSRIDNSVDLMMVRSGVHHENLGAGVRLLDHVRNVMAVILGKRGSEDDEVEGTIAQLFEHTFAIGGSRHLMASLLEVGGMSGESLLVGLTIKNLDRWLGSWLRYGFGCGL